MNDYHVWEDCGCYYRPGTNTIVNMNECKIKHKILDGVLKDSGDRETYGSGMVREPSAEKPRFDLCIAEGVPYDQQILTRFAQQMAHGAEKYSDRNWEKANSKQEVDRMKESAFRHFMQWFCDETDEDHAAALLFNIMAVEMTRAKNPEL